ncbi:MAG: type 4a pilus biogenesis protein PilO [Minisyncoccia bacterium]
MNFILPIILSLLSVGVFFGYVNPNYKGNAGYIEGDYSTYGVTQLRVESAKYQASLDGSQKVLNKRKELTDKRNVISDSNKSRLTVLLPDNIDNLKLILEISNIASQRNLSLKNLSVGSTVKKSDAVGPDSTPYGTVSLSFAVNATYDNFLAFLRDLEDNLRIIDVSSISFNASDNGFYDFNFTINTYWLK